MEYEFMLPSASGLLGQVGEFPPAARQHPCVFARRVFNLAVRLASRDPWECWVFLLVFLWQLSHGRLCLGWHCPGGGLGQARMGTPGSHVPSFT